MVVGPLSHGGEPIGEPTLVQTKTTFQGPAESASTLHAFQAENEEVCKALDCASRCQDFLNNPDVQAFINEGGTDAAAEKYGGMIAMAHHEVVTPNTPWNPRADIQPSSKQLKDLIGNASKTLHELGIKAADSKGGHGGFRTATVNVNGQIRHVFLKTYDPVEARNYQLIQEHFHEQGGGRHFPSKVHASFLWRSGDRRRKIPRP